ncbi:alpha/beta hydrolase [Atopomonas sediminilitoris]|uniref:alpha/beta hydrolase n=1 Tax=Atopomonas sediminilitoris TaxID=2919919 RepID=UPI001F4DBC67|nr:alpha/beta hydrolase [Atopomonas sediminilitoris]MCJ8168921.1 alpha/beta hydrolase [Atopomonas sediminilitoris]
MNAPLLELPAVDQLPRSQRLLRAGFRGLLTLAFRSVIRPPMPVAWQRFWLRALTLTSQVPRSVSIRATTLGGVPAEQLSLAQTNPCAVLYLHGGAFCIGSARTHRSITANLARLSGATVYALDYRLAPEHPYPAGLDDAVAAYQALLAQGFKPEQLAIAGDSAGGNLALTCALRLQRQGLPQPAALLTLSPLTDASRQQLHQPPAGDPLLNVRWVAQASADYCAPAQLNDPLVSPVFAGAEQLAALPPVMIQVGEDEILLNDSLRMHQALLAAGNEVVLERYADYWHVFQAQAGVLLAADIALQRLANFLKQHWRDA